jgi:nicotinate-nucleotide adenylyltransferase
MERIGLLGGTFNPVHNGHIHLAREFCARLSLSRVLLIPTQFPPHKQKNVLAPAPMRLEMCRIAAAHEPHLEVSDIEISRGGTSYTVDTLKELSAHMKNTAFFFIMGADMFLTLEQWRDFEEIVRLTDLCAASRHTGEIKDLENYAKNLTTRFHARCHIERIPVAEVSSTHIRRLIASGGDAAGLLPAGVYEYIRVNGLYAGTGV